ncbi:GspH/FimT family pseudopilin [Pseudomonas sp. CFBP 13719]|uniref:GspH/FimT family pseudopilin n=1 Tax=Pseudomonas sp. CFBP 13719 TaxID=2775303 RepID=UPI000F068685|nr:GspH/FimT family pseudopilin [Pseudomonas sp. CFBP 13719]MBD8683445.1 GspH/FimT family pseudopilin [Pseudomonas sp. CFBP 13719]
MRHGYKGFTLVELMVTVAVLAILVTVGIPSFVNLLNNSKADTEVGDVVRAFNYARLEAINRGVPTQVRTEAGNSWTGRLTVVINTGATAPTAAGSALRVIPAMSSAAALNTPNIAYIEFNNMGALTYPISALNITYTQGAVTRNFAVCVNGRVVASGTC